jgi:TolB-like protein
MPDFVTELKRRNVFRVGVAYVVVAWVIAQVLDLVTDSVGAPDWVIKVSLTLLAVGLPVALIFAWAFELTPEGLKRSEDVPQSESIAPRTGQRLNYVTTTALVLALAFIAWDKLGTDDAPAAGSVADKSVAVLPFADLSEAKDQEWFADGLTEEILNALARLPELQVTARTSSFEFKNTNKDIRGFAEQLGVAHIVEGSVRRIGHDLRVTAQLIRASDGFHLWSNTYDRNTADLFEVQDDVAESIAATLDVILDDDKRQRMFVTGTRDVAAFDAFLKGRELFGKAHDRNSTELVTLADANVYFDRALELDPGYAQAATFHSDRFAHYLMEGYSLIVGDADELDVESAYAQMQRDYDFVARSASDEGSRLVAEINREFFAPRWHRLPGLIEGLEAVVRSGTSLPPTPGWLFEILLVNHKFDTAAAIFEHRKKVDPLNAAAWRNAIDLELSRRDPVAAATLLEEARRKFGDTQALREREVTIQLLAGNKAAAIELMQSGFDFSADFAYMEPFLAALQGDKERALELALEIENRSAIAHEGLVWVYLEIGDDDRARKLIAAIDSSKLGPATLALRLAFSGFTYKLGTDAAPNLRKRLGEARIDPSLYLDLTE